MDHRDILRETQVLFTISDSKAETEQRLFIPSGEGVILSTRHLSIKINGIKFLVDTKEICEPFKFRIAEKYYQELFIVDDRKIDGLELIVPPLYELIFKTNYSGKFILFMDVTRPVV
jgi:hypothetical protein